MNGMHEFRLPGLPHAPEEALDERKFVQFDVPFNEAIISQYIVVTEFLTNKVKLLR